MQTLNKKKILTICIIIGLFALIIFGVSTIVSKSCGSGSQWDDKTSSCIPVCTDGQKYYHSIGKCSVCPPGETSDPDYGCVPDCKKLGDHYILCGGKCIDSDEIRCKDNKQCYWDRIQYDDTCCEQPNYYRLPPALITIGKTESIKVILTKLVPLKIITSEQIDPITAKFKTANISFGIDLLNLDDVDWVNIKDVAQPIIDSLRPACGEKICTTCETSNKCGEKCCKDKHSCAKNSKNSYSCCEDTVHTDSKGLKVCCKPEKWAEKDDMCCDPNDPNAIPIDGRCSYKCEHKTIKGDDISCAYNQGKYCVNIDYQSDNNGNKIPPHSFCGEKPAGCEFTGTDQSPREQKQYDLAQYDDGTHAPSKNHSIPLLYNGSNPNASKYVVYNSLKTSKTGCTPGDCWNSIAHLSGVMSVDVLDGGDGSTHCIAKRAAKGIDSILGQKGIPTLQKQDQLCYDDNTFNGHVCPEGAVCLNNECILGWVPNGKKFPNMDCVPSKTDSTHGTKDDCMRNMCDPTTKPGTQCCAAGWDYKRGKCFQQALPSNRTLLDQTHTSGLARACNTAAKQKGTCGLSWAAECVVRGSLDDDSPSCAAHPADGGPPPNKILPYCICASPAAGWVNYEKGSTYRPVVPEDGYNDTMASCSASAIDNCK